MADVFTDEDLTELKRSLIPGGKLPPRLISGPGAISSSYIKALLARLEAAENALDHNVPTDHDYIAWRKAAGKEPS